MVVRKILESTLVAGATTVSFTDTEIPNSLLRVYCTKSGLFPISQTLSGNSVTVNYKPQDSNVGVALEIVKSGLDIVDDLETEDSSKALSANQGAVLKGLIDDLSIPDNITDLDDVSVASIQNGQVLAWDDTVEKFVNVNQSGGGSGGCFINTDNLITSGTLPSNTEVSYTATQDCIVIYAMACQANGQIYAKINDVNVFSSYIPSQLPLLSFQSSSLLKQGQTIKMLSSYTGGPGEYKVYGLQ